jgi:hypothetical protein
MPDNKGKPKTPREVMEEKAVEIRELARQIKNFHGVGLYALVGKFKTALKSAVKMSEEIFKI